MSVAPVPDLSDDTTAPEDCSQLKQDMERAVSKVCPQWLRSRRDDIVQAALIRVWEVQKRNSGRTSLARGYLSRVAHSVLVDEIRKTQRQMESPLENDGGTVSLSTGDPYLV